MAKLTVLAILALIACFMMFNVNAFTDRRGNDCPCAITLDMNYVCGTDGNSYVNPSALNCENKCKRSNIQILRRGKC